MATGPTAAANGGRGGGLALLLALALQPPLQRFGPAYKLLTDVFPTGTNTQLGNIGNADRRPWENSGKVSVSGTGASARLGCFLWWRRGGIWQRLGGMI